MATISNQAKHDMLNLTPTQLDKFITTTEKEVTDLMVVVQEKEGPFKVAEQMYQEAKSDLDTANASLTDSKLLLHELVRYRESSKSKSGMHLVRPTSHTDQPRSPKLKEFPWLELAKDALTTMNRFILFDELYAVILQKNPDVFKGVNKIKLNKEIKPRVHQGFKRAAVPKTRKKQVIVIYKEKIGLAEWMEGKTPQAKFMKDFMFKEKATA